MAGRALLRRPSLTVTEQVVVVYTVLLVAVSLARAADPWPLVALSVAYGLTVHLVAVTIEPGSRWQRVRDFAPAFFVIAGFLICGRVVDATHGQLLDPALSSLDARYFPAVAADWRTAFGRPSALTDVASLAYFSYYLYPVAAAVALRDDREGFDHLMIAASLSCLVACAFYLFLPAAGPRVPMEVADTVLGGGLPSQTVRAFIHFAEPTTFDAFPSGHTAVTLTVTSAVWRQLPRWRLPGAALCGAIIFATVYLSFHYVIDIVAGLAVAAVLIPLSYRLARRGAERYPPREARPVRA